VRLDARAAFLDDGLQARRFAPGGMPGEFVAPEVEEPHQNAPALADVSGEELVEGPLGQEHRLGEGREVEADDLLEPPVDGPDASLLDVGHGRSALDALERRLVRVPSHSAGDAVVPVVDPEVEADAHVGRAVRDQVAQLVGVDTRNPAVDGEGDRVEDAALARAGGAGDDEEVEVGKVDLLRRLEGGQSLDRQRERPHAAVASSSRRSNRSRSWASGSAP
jgi:hypothetical protein